MVANEGAFESTVPPRPSREHRAAIVLALTGLFTLALTLLFGGVAIGERPVAWAILLAGPLVGALTMLTASFGLNARERWATSVVTPLLLVLLIGDLINTAFALTHSSIPIPLVSVLVIWALRAPSEPGWAAEPAGTLESTREPIRDTRRRRSAGGIVLVCLLVAADLWPFATMVALQPGSPLVASESDLTSELTLGADCVAGGPPPASIDVTFSWAWNRQEPWPNGPDSVVLTWHTVREEGNYYSLYTLDPIPAQGAGIVESNRSIGENEGIVYRIDRRTPDFDHGHVTLTLHRPDVPPAHGLVQVTSGYTHEVDAGVETGTPGLWTQSRVARCEW